MEKRFEISVSDFETGEIVTVNTDSFVIGTYKKEDETSVNIYGFPVEITAVANAIEKGIEEIEHGIGQLKRRYKNEKRRNLDLRRIRYSTLF